jgi:SPP1 gp7 family putative phage head morphogenesis protein
MRLNLFARQYAEELLHLCARYEPRIVEYLQTLWLTQVERMRWKEIEYAVTYKEVPLEWIFAWQEDYATFVHEKIDPAWRVAIKEAGGLIADVISKKITPFEFTPTRLQVIRWIENRSGELIRGLTDRQVQAVRDILHHYTLESPVDPSTLGRVIRSVVGLTPREALAVARFRDSLLSENLPLDKVEKQVERYVKHLHMERGLRIARTELGYAWNVGEYEAVTEAQEKGILRGRLEKEWITARDELTCPICGEMDGEVVDKDQPFSCGVLLPPAHVNCRCAHAYLVEG